MINKKKILLCGVVFTIFLGVEKSAARQPIVDKTSALPKARTPIFIRFNDNDADESINKVLFEVLKPKKNVQINVSPNDRRKIVEVLRNITKKSENFDLVGELTLPDSNRVKVHVSLKGGTLYFSVLKSTAIEKPSDLFKIAKSAGTETYVFGNWRVNISFYISLFNLSYHTIEIRVEPKDYQASSDEEEREERLKTNDERDRDAEEVLEKPGFDRNGEDGAEKRTSDNEKHDDEEKREGDIFDTPLPTLN